MAEVNKEEMRQWAQATLEASENLTPIAGDYDARWKRFDECESNFCELASPSAVIYLLDESDAQSARIAELERECERLRERLEINDQRPYDGIALRDSAIKFMGDEITKLRGSLEACRKDAERYRWLKIHAHDAGMWDDESIDAAMKEGADNAAT